MHCTDHAAVHEWCNDAVRMHNALCCGAYWCTNSLIGIIIIIIIMIVLCVAHNILLTSCTLHNGIYIHQFVCDLRLLHSFVLDGFSAFGLSTYLRAGGPRVGLPHR